MTAPVAVAVVSTNVRELLVGCLRSLQADAEAGRAEVWVVDNASSDGSPEMVAADFPWVHLVASDENLGYGGAVNLVAARSNSPWIAPANEDIELEPGALAALLAAGEAHPEAGIVAPRLIRPDGSTQHSVYPFPSPGFALLFNSGIPSLNPGLADRLCLEGAWDPERAREVPWPIATFLLVRREAFDAAGGFAPDQWMHSEDIDLAWRIRRADWTARYEPSARVRHRGSVATRRAFGEDLRSRWMASTYAWMARRRGLTAAYATAAINTAGAALRAAALTPRARAHPERYGERLADLRSWVSAHRTGLRSPRALREHHLRQRAAASSRPAASQASRNAGASS